MTMTPKELEYLAECEPIRIVPSFNMKPMNLISGNMGPFRAGIPCQVPLWMAINMSRRSKCKIVPPEWMCVETLRAVKKAERDSDFFTPMPAEHFMAIGKILFKECPGQIADCDEVKTLMKDIWDIRYAKLRKSVKIFLAQEKLPMMAQVDHLTMLEMCQIRPYLTHSLEQIHRVKQVRLISNDRKPDFSLASYMLETTEVFQCFERLKIDLLMFTDCQNRTWSNSSPGFSEFEHEYVCNQPVAVDAVVVVRDRKLRVPSHSV